MQIIKKPSNYLIILSILIIFLGILMFYLVYINVSQLQYNAKLINETGIIRGSIQRATKLMIAGKINSSLKVIKNIDFKINSILKDMSYKGELKKFVEKNFTILQKEWRSLKNLLLKYKIAQNERLKNNIIKISEKCWSIADEVVLNTQIMTQYRISGIKIFYIILGINILSAFLVILLVYQYIKKRLEYESSYDSLTKIYNKRIFDETLSKLSEAAKRYNRPLSLIVFDIDNFKLINDKYGHKVGDKVLSKLASTVKNSIRKCDIISRIGGEEFAILCPETDINSAYKVAEKIRKIVENTYFEKVGKVTISIGVSELLNNITEEEFFKMADAAMYYSKANGKNKTEMYNINLSRIKDIFNKLC